MTSTLSTKTIPCNFCILIMLYFLNRNNFHRTVLGWLKVPMGVETVKLETFIDFTLEQVAKDGVKQSTYY